MPLRLGVATMQRLRELAASERTTLFVVLLAALQVCIASEPLPWLSVLARHNVWLAQMTLDI